MKLYWHEKHFHTLLVPFDHFISFDYISFDMKCFVFLDVHLLVSFYYCINFLLSIESDGSIHIQQLTFNIKLNINNIKYERNENEMIKKRNTKNEMLFNITLTCSMFFWCFVIPFFECFIWNWIIPLDIEDWFFPVWKTSNMKDWHFFMSFIYLFCYHHFFSFFFLSFFPINFSCQFFCSINFHIILLLIWT